jgi:hypothetical protein
MILRMEVKMSDGADGYSKQIENGPRKKPFLLCELKEGGKDKLGHEVEELLWLAQNYAIYRSRPGVYIQFSDFPEQEADQRKRFTEISPELCELRYLTYEMRSRPAIGFRWRTDRQPSTLYEHNIAQALMLVIEDKETEGKQIAQQALKMAVQRVTNDNTVRYLRACLIFWIILVTIGVALLFFLPSHEFKNFVVAAISGATGAVLSVAIRLQALPTHTVPSIQHELLDELHPRRYWFDCGTHFAPPQPDNLRRADERIHRADGTNGVASNRHPRTHWRIHGTTHPQSIREDDG